MQKTVYFYRKYKSSSFEKSEKRKMLCFVIPKDNYHEKPLLWNAKNKKFEQIELSKEEKLCSVSKKCVVELPEYEKIDKETASCGDIFSNAFTNLFERKTFDAKVLTQAALDLTSKNFASFVSYEYKSKKNDYYEARKIDKNGIPRKDFAYEFKIDYENFSLTFSRLYIDSNLSEKYSTQKYLFDIKNGFVENLSNPIKSLKESPKEYDEKSKAELLAKAFILDFRKERLPEKIVQTIFKILKELACRFTEKNLSFQKISKKNNLGVYFSNLVYIPFCPNLAGVLFHSPAFSVNSNIAHDFPLNRKDGNVFNEFLDFIKVPNTKQIRKTFQKDYRVIEIAYKLKNAGFSDLNAFNLATKNSSFFDIIFDITERDNSIQENLSFFVKYSFSKKSEIATMKTLLKFDKDEWRGTYTDALNMFRLYFEHIPEILRKRILRYGFNKKNHDELSLLGASLKNIPFKYSEEQFSLEQKIEDYEFALPKDSTQLVEIGMKLHNCVASYSDDIIGKKCTIVYAKKDGKYVLCIEVRGNKVHQERADSNFDPNKEQNRILKIWHESHGLEFTGNEF